MEDELFSRKSKAYRNHHMEAVKHLYGEKQYIPLKPLSKRKVKRRSPYGIEDTMQIKLVAWIKYMGLKVISIPNKGKRSYWTGQKEVAMGLWKGASDVFLTHMSKGYGGFFIELKSPGEKPRVEQIEFMEIMRSQGYKAEWYDNFDIAKSEIMTYLELDKSL
jgi:hypothetical protein